MLPRLATLTTVLLTALIPVSQGAAGASEYKEYCVVTTTPAGPQPPSVCVVDPTP